MRTCLRCLPVLLLAGIWLGVPTSSAQTSRNLNVIFSPEPVIPEVAKRKGWGGRGTYRLTIDPKTGSVQEVKVLKRVGYPVLDAEMVMTLFKWRFKPHTVTTYTMSCEIGILGRAHDYHTNGY